MPAKRKQALASKVDAALQAAAFELTAVAPWRKYTPDSFFTICDSSEEEYFLSFYNNDVHCLSGLDGLRSYIRFLHNRSDEVIRIALKSLCLSSNYDKYSFTSFEPGFVPWPLNDDEAELLTLIYKQATELLKWFRAERPKMSFVMLDSPTRRYSNGIWINEIRQIKLTPPPPKIIEPPDEMSLYRARSAPMTGAYWELEVIQLLESTQDDEQDRPYYPTLIMLANQGANEVSEVRAIPPGHDITAEVTDLLLDMIISRGKPQRIYVQSRQLYDMLSYICDDMDVSVELVRFLSSINFYVSERGIKT